MKQTGENVVRIEAEALRALADRLAGPMAEPFERAVELLYGCAGRVVVSGMGKSGLIARKIAATLTSTGSPALFLHPAEAMHGDLGMVVRGDVVLALSASGETEEILQLLATVKRLGVPLITMTCDEITAGASSGRFDPGAGSRCRTRLLGGERSLHISAWRRPPRRPPCSRSAMRWRSPSRSDAASRKKTSPTCIPAASWASASRGSRR